MSTTHLPDRTAEAPEDIIEAVWWDVSNHTYSSERELNGEITTTLHEHDVQRCWRADIRSQIVTNWRTVRTEHPDDGTWSP